MVAAHIYSGAVQVQAAQIDPPRPIIEVRIRQRRVLERNAFLRRGSGRGNFQPFYRQARHRPGQSGDPILAGLKRDRPDRGIQPVERHATVEQGFATLQRQRRHMHIGHTHIQPHAAGAIGEIVIGAKADLAVLQHDRQSRAQEFLDRVGLERRDGKPALRRDRRDGKIARPVELFAALALRGQGEGAALLALGVKVLERESDRGQRLFRPSRLALIGVGNAALVHRECVDPHRRAWSFRARARHELDQVQGAVGADHRAHKGPVQSHFAETVCGLHKRQNHKGNSQMADGDHGPVGARYRQIVHVQREGEGIEVDLSQRDLFIQIDLDPLGGLGSHQPGHPVKAGQHIKAEQ